MPPRPESLVETYPPSFHDMESGAHHSRYAQAVLGVDQSLRPASAPVHLARQAEQEQVGIMRHVAQHAITALGSVVVAVLWLTPFVERVLMSIWPIVAGALALVVLCSSLALCIWLLSLSLRALRPPPPQYEIIQGGSTTYARDVTPAPILDEDEHIVHDDQWRVMVTRFCFIGNAVGFSVRKLDPYITRSKRQVYVDL